MSEATIRVKGLSFARVSAPDLAEAAVFLAEFGLREVARQGDAIYFRGTDAAPPCYALTKGASGVTSIGFEADRRSDLEAVTRIEGASGIEKLDEPGGGERVRLQDPQGMQVEIVFGRAAQPALEPAPTHAFNMDGGRARLGTLPAIRSGPCHVRRLGHLVLESADPERVFAWYRDHLGLQASDTVRLPSGEAQMVFAHLDRGAEFVDHHVVGFQFSMDEGDRVQHLAFEVGNLDDLMSGHEHLKARRRKHVWGVGRHLLGGQIFDYWKSPWGVIHEHWTDTDLVNETHQPTDCGVGDVNDYWGPGPTPGFVVSRWNWKALRNLARVLRARFG